MYLVAIAMEVLGPLIVIGVALLALLIVVKLLREWIVLLIAASFLGVACTRLVRGVSPLDMTIVHLVVGAVFYVVFLLMHDSERRKRFLIWLAEHEDELRAGTLTYEGHPIDLSTVVKSYRACVSIIMISWLFHSRYYFTWQPSRTRRTVYTIVTVLLGWWGLPDGPIWSVQAIMCNREGGEQRALVHSFLT